MGSSCFCCLALKSPVHLFRVDCDEIVICDEVAASSADDLKKAKKVNMSAISLVKNAQHVVQVSEPGEEGVVCIE